MGNQTTLFIKQRCLTIQPLIGKNEKYIYAKIKK